MSGDERQARYEAQTREQFEALGRFVQAFEQMVHALRMGIESRLQSESPNMVHFTRMLFHHQVLTAWPLWEMFRGVIYTDISEIRPLEAPEIRAFHDVLTKLGREVQALLSARNNILHGTPFIGWASAEQEDFSELTIMKWGVSAKGWKVTETPKSVSAVMELVNRCSRAETAANCIRAANVFRDNRNELLRRASDALETD